VHWDHQTRRQDGNKKKERQEVIGTEVFAEVIKSQKELGEKEQWSQDPPEIVG
jgi:hypothetical protein